MADARVLNESDNPTGEALAKLIVQSEQTVPKPTIGINE